MLNQKVNIGFAIWGVRNGFEVMLTSNPSEAEFLRSDVITDNMRQVCNTTSESFYSIHRNSKFAVATIYHCDAKDMVGRKAYVAISLYIPTAYQFIGDVYAVLNYLKNYYVQKQSDSYVNMFTAEMFMDQYRSLDCQQNNGFVIPGTKKGYYKFTSLSEVKERFQLLDINGYQVAFFIPSTVNGPETQLSGFQLITEFKDTLSVTIEGFDSTRYKIQYKDQPITTSESKFLLEVKPGDELVFVDLVNSRRQSFTKYTPNQVISLSNLFPKIASSGYRDPYSSSSVTTKQEDYYGSSKKSPKWRSILASGMILVIFVAFIIMALVEFEIIDDPLENFNNSANAETSQTQEIESEENQENGKAVLQKLNPLKKNTYDVQGLYEIPKLKNTDTVKIKEKMLSLKGIKGISFTGGLTRIEVSYDSLEVETFVHTSLKSIKLDVQSINPGKESKGKSSKSESKPQSPKATNNKPEEF